MGQSPLYGPMFIQMALSLAILYWLAYSRLSRVKKQGIAEIQKTGFPAHVNNTSDNFKNQFELPVIFYGLCFFFVISGSETKGVLIAAWVFVIMRILHTLIQCTNNKIFPNRFLAFLMSAIALTAMLVMAVMQHLAA